MEMLTTRIETSSRGNADMINLTDKLNGLVRGNRFLEGQLLAFVVGSTAALTTIEYEPGLIQDVPELLDRLIPPGRYHHDETWHDGNGHSHLRASLIGPSLVVPVSAGEMTLGTWQQVVLVDMDNRARRREVVVQLTGRFASKQS